MKSGLYTDLSNADYHASSALGSSQIKRMTNLAKAKHAMEHRFKSSDAMLLGSLVHTLVLEPHKFGKEYVVEPEDAPKRPTKAQINAKKPSDAAIESIKFWNEWDSANSNKTVIDKETLRKAEHMYGSVWTHPEAKSHIVDGIAEQSIFWEHDGQQLKCRPDYTQGSVIVDLKTAQDASPYGFAKAVSNFRYDIQQSLYEDGCRTQFEVTDFIFVVVESTAPYLTAVYRLDKEYVDYAREQYQSLLYDWKTAQDFGIYKGYSDEIVAIKKPAWVA